MEEQTKDLLENTPIEIVEKIQCFAMDIRNDWNDPRYECRKIDELCDKLAKLLKQ